MMSLTTCYYKSFYDFGLYLYALVSVILCNNEHGLRHLILMSIGHFTVQSYSHTSVLVVFLALIVNAEMTE